MKWIIWVLMLLFTLQGALATQMQSLGSSTTDSNVNWIGNSAQPTGAYFVANGNYRITAIQMYISEDASNLRFNVSLFNGTASGPHRRVGTEQRTVGPITSLGNVNATFSNASTAVQNNTVYWVVFAQTNTTSVGFYRIGETLGSNVHKWCNNVTSNPQKYCDTKWGNYGGGAVQTLNVKIFGETVSPIVNKTLKVQAVNNVSGATITGLCAVFKQGASTVRDACNLTGTFVTYQNNVSALFNITTYNISSGTFFNQTRQGFNFTAVASQTLNAHTYQGLLRLNATRLFLGTGIGSFNATNRLVRNQTTNGIVLVRALNGSNNVKVDVKGNYTQNVTCTIATPLSTASCTVTGIYDNKFTIGINYKGAAVNSFWGNVTNTSLSLANNTKTTNGQIVYNLLRGYRYTFSVNSTNYTTESATLSANATTNRYNFTVYQVREVNLTLRDEITRALLSGINFTIELLGSPSTGTYYTSNGTLFLGILSPGDYTVRYRSTDYPERDYYVTVTGKEIYDLTLYAISFNESDTVLTSVVDTGGDAVQDAIVKLLRYYVYCDCYEVVEMAKSSYAGQSYFNAQYYEGHYKWAVDYEGTNYFLSEAPENLVPDDGDTIVTRSFTINLGQDYYGSYVALSSIGAACTYNSTSGGFSFIWSDPNDEVTRGCADAEYLDGVDYESVGQTCQSASTGSVVLNLNTSREYKYSATLTIGGVAYSVPDCQGWIDAPPDYDFGTLGVFLSMGILITLALAFSFSAVGVLVVTAIGTLIISLLGFMSIGQTFITGFCVLVLGLGVYTLRS